MRTSGIKSAHPITPDGFKVSINSREVTVHPYDIVKAFPPPYSYPLPIADGTWGFGPYQDQVALVSNVTVLAENGTLVYENDMTSHEVLAEYGVCSNSHSFCSDGAKRDRLVWIGVDFAHALRGIGASTGRLDFATGTMDWALEWQATSGENKGLVAIDAQMGASSEYESDYYSANYNIADWELWFLVQMGEYFQLSGDADIMRKYWGQIRILTQTLLQEVDPHTGLMAAGSYLFDGPNRTVPSATTIIALRGLIPIADAIGDHCTSRSWQRAAESLGSAVNKLMWNRERGVYSISLDKPNNFSLLSLSLPIRAGIANQSQVASMISALPALKLGPAFKEWTGAGDGPTVQLSSCLNGFLLEALFIANQTFHIPCLDIVGDLFDNFWSLMITQNQYATGTTWEYMFQDGSPEIELYTAHSHEWGVSPTYVMSDYVLGVMATKPGFESWKFEPSIFGLNMTTCQGTVPTPYCIITASWELSDDTSHVKLMAQGPHKTTGTLQISVSNVGCECGGRAVSCEEVRTDENGLLEATVYLR